MKEDLGVFQLDLRKTKQIMYNLLSNAVKFSGQDGVVTLSAARVPRSAVGFIDGGWPMQSFPLPEGDFTDFVELKIRDSGIGISAENMTKLFQAFSQIDSSLARKFEGTGLGLAMVKRLAELHGGTVAVASAEEEGSCFAVWLPIRAVTSTVEKLQSGLDYRRIERRQPEIARRPRGGGQRARRRSGPPPARGGGVHRPCRCRAPSRRSYLATAATAQPDHDRPGAPRHRRVGVPPAHPGDRRRWPKCRS